MKTLNRPMFRYGGPIKEGVMHGIREPKRNGGSMGEPQAINTVGSPLSPMSNDGRANYAAPLIPIGMGLAAAARAGARYIPRGINYLKNLGRTRTGSTTSTVPKQGPTFPGRTTTTQGGFGAPVTTRTGTSVGPGSATIETPTYTPNFLGRDPLIQAGGKLVNALVNPTTGGLISKGARVVFSPSGAIIGGLYYANGKFFNKKGEEVEKPEGDIKIGGTADIKGGGADTEAVKLTPEQIKAAEAKARMEKMDSYKEIMNIKGMSKDAAYKSLIDASQIIADNGNLKEGIKDGSLIARLTGAASKRFDKVSDTETALRSLVAKGEIENEMNKEAKALARRKDELAIKTYEKTLAGDSFDEAVLKSITGTGGKMPTGNKLAGILKATRGIDSVVLDGSKVPPGGEIKFVQDSVDKKVSEGTSINPGAYVINSKIVIVDEQGNVSQYY